MNNPEEMYKINKLAKSILRFEQLSLYHAPKEILEKEIKIKHKWEENVKNISNKDEKIKFTLEYLIKEKIQAMYGNTGCYNCTKKYPKCNENKVFKYDAVMLCNSYEPLVFDSKMDDIIDKLSDYGIRKLKLKNMLRSVFAKFMADYVMKISKKGFSRFDLTN